MIEDYGKLSEEELIEEITQQLEEDTEVDVHSLDFTFEAGRLIVHGHLTNDEQLQALIDVLENNLDPEDYDLEIELAEESSASDKLKPTEEFGDKINLEEDEFGEEIEGEEVEFADDDEDYNDDKW